MKVIITSFNEIHKQIVVPAFQKRKKLNSSPRVERSDKEE